MIARGVLGDRVSGLGLMGVVVFIGLAFFAYHYTHYLAVPGNDPDYPLGWWDQSLYLKATNNFLTGAITPDAQAYPPLYPALAAVFLPLSEMHGYLPLTLLLFGVYLWAFMTVFR